MRITCSGSEEELSELMNRLQSRLLETRHNKKVALMDSIAQKLVILNELDKTKHDAIMMNLVECLSVEETCLSLKETNRTLKELDMRAGLYIKKCNASDGIKAATTIQSYFRGHVARKEKNRLAEHNNHEWHQFVDSIVSGSQAMRSYFLNLSIPERLSFLPWKEHLSSKAHNIK